MTVPATAGPGHDDRPPSTAPEARPRCPASAAGFPRRGAGPSWPLPAAMVLFGIVSVQAGAGIADKLFREIPPDRGDRAAAVVVRGRDGRHFLARAGPGAR